MAVINKDFRVKHGLVVEGEETGAEVKLNGATSGTTTLKPSAVASGTLTFPAATGTVALTSDIPSLSGYVTESGTQTLTNKTLTSPIVDGNGIIFEGLTADDFETTLTVVDPTADRTITLPNVSGTVITTGDTGSVTNTMLAGSISNDKLSNSAITINGVSTSLGGTRTLGTDDISEGTTNKYFTDERAQDAIGVAIANGTQTNITVTYDDSTNALSFNASGGVSSLTGTANEVEVSSSTGAVTIGLPNDITIAGNITISGTPTNSNHAATVAYVDAATAGLNVHDSVKAATTVNIDLSTDLENGDTLDGGPGGAGAVTLATGNRVLVKNQTNKAQNGVYIVQASGAAVRAADYNSSPEVDAGDFIFVEGGYINGKTGWVQTNTITTIGTDDIEFTQFSGAGTYQAGTGIQLSGNTFSIDSTVTTNSGTQTLTNKTLTSPTVSGLYLSDNNIVVEGTDDIHETTVTFTDPTGDRVITFKDETGTVAYTADITSAINALSTTDIEEGTNLYYTAERVQDEINDTLTAGSGIGLTYTDNGAGDGTLSIANTGVLSITGTANQVSASASTGAVTLSLPQNIHTAATPTFAGVTVGSVTLADALIGTATESLTDGTATVIDSWLVASYSSAKYIVQMKKGDDIEVIEVIVTVDGNNNVYLTEYADVISNVQLGTTDADYSSGSVRLKVTASNGTTVKVHKTLIEA